MRKRSAIADTLVSQVVSLNKTRSRAAYAWLFFVAMVRPGLVVLALYMPTLELMWRHSLE